MTAARDKLPARLLGYIVNLTAAMLRCLPQSVPGRYRVASTLTELAARFGARPRLTGSMGILYTAPTLDESIIAEIVADGVAEPATLRELTARLPKGGVLFDVGANIGALALPFAKRRPDATIVCFEPARPTVEHLSQNIESNGLADRIQVFNLALGSVNESNAAFYAPEHGFGRASLKPVFSMAAQSVEVRRLDDLIFGDGDANLPIPDLLKVDVEGHEWHVFEGARRLFTEFKPVVVFEYCDWAEELAGRRPGDAQRLLMSLGYRIHRIGEPDRALPDAITRGFGMLVAEFGETVGVPTRPGWPSES